MMYSTVASILIECLLNLRIGEPILLRDLKKVKSIFWRCEVSGVHGDCVLESKQVFSSTLQMTFRDMETRSL